MLSAIGLRVRTSSDPDAVPEFARTLRLAGLRLFMPAVIVVLGTGIWLVAASSEWSFSQTWVRIAVGLGALAFLIGAVYLSQVSIQLGKAADGTGNTNAAVLVSRWLVGYGAVLVILLVAVWDMVFKPGS